VNATRSPEAQRNATRSPPGTSIPWRSETARNALRSKLAEFTALRARSTETAIEAAVGRQITDAQAYRERHGKRETLVVRLELDHGAEVLVLEGR
jgi:hypothetical protein